MFFLLFLSYCFLQVYKRSYDVCTQLYEKELLTENSYLHVYGFVAFSWEGLHTYFILFQQTRCMRLLIKSVNQIVVLIAGFSWAKLHKPVLYFSFWHFVRLQAAGFNAAQLAIVAVWCFRVMWRMMHTYTAFSYTI